MITPAAALSDPNLLSHAFAGASWDTWRAVLKAAYGEPLDEAELARFKAVAGDRDPPTRQVRELIVVAGRRSGKDSIASAIATTAAIADYGPFLRPGERASVLCLAVNREQARIVNRYVAAYFQTIPLLAPFVARETEVGLELNNGVEIVLSTNSFRAVRGKTIACSIFDEASFWRAEDSANPDLETYNAVMPGMVTLPGAMLIIITTAYRRSGLAYQKWHAHFAKNDDDVLVVYGPTPAFNPTVPQRIIDDALRDDPEKAGAEWLSQWRSDLSDFLDRELVGAAVDRGVVVRPPHPAHQYRAFADVSGGTGGDSFALAIAHAEGEAAILDCVFEARPPFNPSIVVGETVALLRAYQLSEATGDNWGAGWVSTAFAEKGVAYIKSTLNRSELYLNALPLFTAGKARILDNDRLVAQLVALERRTGRLGKDSVNHPPGGHDDVSNVVAGALVLVSAQPDRGLLEWRVAGMGSDSDYYAAVARVTPAPPAPEPTTSAPEPIEQPAPLPPAALVIGAPQPQSIPQPQRPRPYGFPITAEDLAAAMLREPAAPSATKDFSQPGPIRPFNPGVKK